MDPGPRCAISRLKGLDFLVALQCQGDFIETSEQSGAPARIDLEAGPLSCWRGDGLFLEIDADTPCPLCEFDLRGKAVDNLLVDDDGQDSVLKTVGEENVAKARADGGADPHPRQRPPRPFGERPATKFGPGNEVFRLP